MKVDLRSLPFGEEFLEFSLHLLSGFFVAKLVLADNVLEFELTRDHISSGHDVVVVHVLHESLHLGSSLDFLLAHSLGDSQWVSLNTSNQSVSELLVLIKRIRGICVRTFFPSSCCLTMIAFFPACLPARRMTTLPGFILKTRGYLNV